MFFQVAKLIKCVFGNEKYCQSMKNKLRMHGKSCQLNVGVKNSVLRCEKCVGKSLVKTATTCQKTQNDLRREDTESASKVRGNDGKDLPIVFTCCSCGSDGSDIDSHRLFSFVLRSFS